MTNQRAPKLGANRNNKHPMPKIKTITVIQMINGAMFLLGELLFTLEFSIASSKGRCPKEGGKSLRAPRRGLRLILDSLPRRDSNSGGSSPAARCGFNHG